MQFFFLSVILPWIISGIWAILFLCIFVFLISFFRYAFSRSRIASILAIVIFILGLFLRFQWGYHTHRILYDEDRYLSYAVTFARFGKAVSIELATPTESIIGIPDSVARLTVPIYHSWILKVFGYSEFNLYIASKAFNSLQTIFLFAFAFLLTSNIWLALGSMLLYTLLPNTLYWSASLALDNYFSTFLLIASTYLLWFAAKKSFPAGMGLLSSFFLLLFVRMEALVAIPFFMLFWKNAAKSISDSLFSKKTFHWIVVFCLIIFFRIILASSLFGQKWCCAVGLPLEAFSTQYFIRHVLLNILSLFNQPEFPWSLSILALIGMMTTPWNMGSGLFTWFLSFFLTYSSYYAGRFYSYEYSGSYGRYFLSLIPPLVLYVGFGATYLLKLWIQLPLGKKIMYGASMVILLALSFYPTIRSYKKLVTESPFYTLVEQGPLTVHQVLTDVILPILPQNGILLTNLTAPVLLSGRTAVYIGSFLDDEKVALFIKSEMEKGIPVYSSPIDVCDVYPLRCAKISKLFNFTPIPLKDVPPSLGIVGLTLKQEP
ncbi:hypothetical protein HY947_00190 [Candidatus Gottesmanbacteria bacterium]|nr:hypothetical protein [Candidatus Gottesmanbacteria bacterium]